MAGRKRLAPQTRNFLAVIIGQVVREGASSEEIVAALRKEHPETIRLEQADILHIGLIKLANDVCNLHSRAGATSAQLEMFAEYDTGPVITLRAQDAKGRTRRVRRAVDSLMLSEARQHIAEHTKPRPRRTKRIAELVRLVDDMKKYSKSESSTIGECWAAARGTP